MRTRNIDAMSPWAFLGGVSRDSGITMRVVGPESPCRKSQSRQRSLMRVRPLRTIDILSIAADFRDSLSPVQRDFGRNRRIGPFRKKCHSTPTNKGYPVRPRVRPMSCLRNRLSAAVVGRRDYFGSAAWVVVISPGAAVNCNTCFPSVRFQIRISPSQLPVAILPDAEWTARV